MLGWVIILQQQEEQYAALQDEAEIDEAYKHFEMALEIDSNDLQVGSVLDSATCSRSLRGVLTR